MPGCDLRRVRKQGLEIRVHELPGPLRGLFLPRLILKDRGREHYPIPGIDPVVSHEPGHFPENVDELILYYASRPSRISYPAVSPHLCIHIELLSKLAPDVASCNKSRMHSHWLDVEARFSREDSVRRVSAGRGRRSRCPPGRLGPSTARRPDRDRRRWRPEPGASPPPPPDRHRRTASRRDGRGSTMSFHRARGEAPDTGRHPWPSGASHDGRSPR